MKSQPTTNLDESLARIARGTGLVFAGTLAGMAFAFFGKNTGVARIGTDTEYGVFSVAFVLLNIFAIIGTLGLQAGVARSIAHARGKGDIEKVHKIIPATILLMLLGSTSMAFIAFFTSDIIATRIFHEVSYAYPLKVMAFAIPVLSIVLVLTSTFRGFDNIRPRIYFHELMMNMLFCLFLAPLLFVDVSFNWVFYLLLASLAITSIAIIGYTIKYLPSRPKLTLGIITHPVTRELFLFSLPLLSVAMLQLIIAWIDILMLEGLRDSSEVGAYNTAHPLAMFISIPLFAMLQIYMPITAGLWGKGDLPQIRKNFSVLTKWLCSVTLPLFLILFLFPEPIINTLFGPGYSEAGNALRILSLGYIINNYLGPNGDTLTAMGRVRFLMWAALATALLNIALNAALIPPLGINGAAIASVVSITSINAMRCVKLYNISRIQPFSKNLVKSTVACLALCIGAYFVYENFVPFNWWLLPPLLVLFYGISLITTTITKSFDPEDTIILLVIEQRTGKDMGMLKRLIQKSL